MKKRIRKTGEIVDVVGFFNTEGEVRSVKDQVYYKPLDGTEVWILKSGMNFYLDFEDVEEPSKEIDWDEVRIKAIMAVLQGISANPRVNYAYNGNWPKWAVQVADALIAELKKGGEK